MKREDITTLFLAVSLGLTACASFVSGCAGDKYTRSTGEYIDDKTLAASVNGALNDAPEYQLGSVAVQTDRGVVQLSGFVNTPDQRTKAGEIARRVPGVKSIENNIAIKPN